MYFLIPLFHQNPKLSSLSQLNSRHYLRALPIFLGLFSTIIIFTLIPTTTHLSSSFQNISSQWQQESSIKVFYPRNTSHIPSQLLSCIEASNYSKYLTYNGRGQPVHDASITKQLGYKLLSTSQFALRVILNQKFDSYSDLTESRDEADYYYMPLALSEIYMCMKSIRQRRGEGQKNVPDEREYIKNVTNHILHSFTNSNIYRRALQKDYPSVIIPLSRIARDCWDLLKGSDYWNELVKVVVFVGIERPLDNDCEASFIQVPYPTMLHDESIDDGEKIVEKILTRERTDRILFAGNCLVNDERKRLCDDIDDFTTRSGHAKRTSFSNDNPGKMIWDMATSRYCLNPPGDSKSRRGFYDSILLGCVPVISDETAYDLFGGLVKAKDVSVVLDFMESENTIKRLAQLPEEVYKNLQYNMLNVRSRMQYSLWEDEESDAFGALLIALKNALRHRDRMYC